MGPGLECEERVGGIDPASPGLYGTEKCQQLVAEQSLPPDRHRIAGGGTDAARGMATH